MTRSYPSLAESFRKEKIMNITVTSSVLVPPATPPPQHILWVSNIDLYLKIHAVSAYIYRPILHSDIQTLCQGLREALGKLLVHFYPLAGRLITGETGRISVNCNSEGALFLEAFTDLKIDDLEDFETPSQLQPLVPTVNYGDHMSAIPLLILQVTKFKCGGIGLGVAISHIVVDGTSAMHFINAWCDIARGVDVNVADLHIDRTLLRARSPPQPSFAHQELSLPSPPLLHKEREGGEVSFVQFSISKEQLNSLKAVPADHNPSKRIYSTFVCLIAHLWKCHCIARGFLETQEVRLRTLVDGRRHLHTPRGYFGNVVFPADVRAISGDIVSKPIWYSGGVIYEALNKMNEEYLRSQLDYLELHPEIGASRDDPFNSASLTIVYWARLELYEADFGWGKPVFVGPGRNPQACTCYIRPSPSDDGSLCIDVALPSDQMARFHTLFYQF